MAEFGPVAGPVVAPELAGRPTPSPGLSPKASPRLSPKASPKASPKSKFRAKKRMATSANQDLQPDAKFDRQPVFLIMASGQLESAEVIHSNPGTSCGAVCLNLLLLLHV